VFTGGSQHISGYTIRVIVSMSLEAEEQQVDLMRLRQRWVVYNIALQLDSYETAS
jgi:hypothetical protein